MSNQLNAAPQDAAGNLVDAYRGSGEAEENESPEESLELPPAPSPSMNSVKSDDQHRMCKFCYSDEIVDDEWLHPCRCAGSMKWVHYKCFQQWLSKAPPQQQVQCLTCKFVYQKCWSLKKFVDWCRPPLQLTTWEVCEIFLDAYSTFKFFRGFMWTLDGKRSFWVQCAHFFFWRTFIATDRRIAYYGNLGRIIMSSVFDITVKDFTGVKKTPRSPTNPIAEIEFPVAGP